MKGLITAVVVLCATLLVGCEGLLSANGTVSYAVYDVYDSSGDYIGQTRIGDYPVTSYTVETAEGFYVSLYSWPGHYRPSLMFVHYDGANGSGNAYTWEIFFNAESATAYDQVKDQWYRVEDNPDAIAYDEVDLLSYVAYSGTEYHEFVRAGTGETNNLMALVPTTLQEIGLPEYDPPFSVVAHEQANP